MCSFTKYHSTISVSQYFQTIDVQLHVTQLVPLEVYSLNFLFHYYRATLFHDKLSFPSSPSHLNILSNTFFVSFHFQNSPAEKSGMAKWSHLLNGYGTLYDCSKYVITCVPTSKAKSPSPLLIASGRPQTLTRMLLAEKFEIHSKSVRTNATRYVDIGGVCSKRAINRPLGRTSGWLLFNIWPFDRTTVKLASWVIEMVKFALNKGSSKHGNTRRAIVGWKEKFFPC